MRIIAALAVPLFFAVPLFADLVPGPTVAEALSLPRVADLDANGLDDLLYDNYALLNLGGARFARYELNIGSESVEQWLDVNGDGRADLLTTEFGSPRMVPAWYRLYIADETLHYRAAGTIDTVASWGGRYTPHPVDLDRDGNDDIVLIAESFTPPRRYAGEVKVLLSNGDGTFREVSALQTRAAAVGVATDRLPAGDLDGDGNVDVVFQASDDWLIVLRGLGEGRFAAEHHYFPFAYTLSPRLADVNGDRRLDLLLEADRTVHVLLGDGEGGFANSASHYLMELPGPAVPPGRAMTPTLVAGEFVQRGRTTIAVTTPEGDIRLLEWRGGALRQIDRLPTEFRRAGIYAGAFFERDSEDLFVTWNWWSFPGERPPNRFFLTGAEASSEMRSTSSGRRVRVAGPAASSRFDLLFEFEPTDCMPAPAVRGVEFRGMFGSAALGGEVLAAVIFDGALYFRISMPSLDYPVWGNALPAGGGFAGTAAALTPCGRREFRVTAVR